MVKKIGLLIVSLPLILMGLIEVNFQVSSYLLQPEFRKRVDFLIECVNKYKAETGKFLDELERQESNCVPDAIVQSNEMFNSEKIVGKGAFVLMDSAFDGEILVIGNWYPPNLIYYFNTNTYKQNDKLFSNNGL